MCPWCGEDLDAMEGTTTYDINLGEHVQECDPYIEEQHGHGK